MPPRIEHRPTRRDFLRQLSLGTTALAGVSLLPRLRAAEAASTRQLGVALVGLGRYSTGQLGPALRETKLCRLAGVVTGSPDKAAQWAKDFELPERSLYNYENMARMADNPDIDIVYVVTPNALHAEHTIAAARAGKHVICEKPMAISVAECDAMIGACQSAGVQLSVGYRLHFDPFHKELKRHAREKDYGVLTKMTGDRGFVMNGRPWRAQRSLAGGGPMMDLGVYIVQGACMASGEVPPIAVTGREEPKTRPEIFQDVEEKISWTMEFPGGARCDAVTSYVHRSDKFRAEGDKGWFEFKERAFTYRGAVCETSEGPLSFPPFNQQAAQMDDFADCVRTGRRSIVPGEMGRRDVRIMMAIYEAARTGKRVTV